VIWVLETGALVGRSDASAAASNNAKTATLARRSAFTNAPNKNRAASKIESPSCQATIELPQRRSGRAHPILRAVLNLPRTIATVIKSGWGGLRTHHAMSAKGQK